MKRIYSNIYPTRCNFTRFIYIWTLLYTFRVVPPPIIRSPYNCTYSIWHLSDRYCYLPLSRQVAVTVWQIPDAVGTVVRAPDDGWRYHPKRVEQFPDINKPCKVASCWIYLLLLLLLALQPTVGFILLSDFLPFCSFSTLLSPPSYSHYLQIFFNACNPSLPWSPSSSRTYRFPL